MAVETPEKAAISLSEPEMREVALAYMTELAANRDKNDEVKPEAKDLMHKMAAILNDPEALKHLMNDLNAASAGGADDQVGKFRQQPAGK